MIALINLGNSNIQSVINALNYLKIEYIKVSNNNDLERCDRIILPGVGTFDNGMKRLEELNLLETLRREVLIKNKPILGICLGMQMLFESSEESPHVKGLNFVSGKVVCLPLSDNYKIPRIGWAESKVHFDFLGLKENQKIDFYYIHSFYVTPQNKDIVAIDTDMELTSAIQYKNIYGCQFHPEKSHLYGLKILESFAKVNPI